MSECTPVKNILCCTVTYPQLEKWNKWQILAVVAGAIIITIGIALKSYRGVNSAVIGSLITAGILTVIIDLFLARKKEDEEVDALSKARRKSLAPPEILENNGSRAAGSPYDLLAKALDHQKVADVGKIINRYLKTTPDLFVGKIDDKTPLQRALLHFRKDPSDINSCYKIVILRLSGATHETGIINGLDPFAFLCQGVFQRHTTREIKLTEEEYALIHKFLPTN